MFYWSLVAAGTDTVVGAIWQPYFNPICLARCFSRPQILLVCGDVLYTQHKEQALASQVILRSLNAPARKEEKVIGAQPNLVAP